MEEANDTEIVDDAEALLLAPLHEVNLTVEDNGASFNSGKCPR